MTQEITMGSLFSGSGGFELAGSIFGIRPIWASEIEPFPILVTTKNFPEMKHLGDINKLNGADLEPVTIIAGGSPCQDMSIAGKKRTPKIIFEHGKRRKIYMPEIHEQ